MEGLGFECTVSAIVTFTKKEAQELLRACALSPDIRSQGLCYGFRVTLSNPTRENQDAFEFQFTLEQLGYLVGAFDGYVIETPWINGLVLELGLLRTATERRQVEANAVVTSVPGVEPPPCPFLFKVGDAVYVRWNDRDPPRGPHIVSTISFSPYFRKWNVYCKGIMGTVPADRIVGYERVPKEQNESV